MSVKDEATPSRRPKPDMANFQILTAPSVFIRQSTSC